MEEPINKLKKLCNLYADLSRYQYCKQQVYCINLGRSCADRIIVSVAQEEHRLYALSALGLRLAIIELEKIYGRE